MGNSSTVRSYSINSSLLRTRRILATLVCAVVLTAAPCVRPLDARASSHTMIGQCVPITMTVTPQTDSSGNTSVVISVQVDTVGGYVQIGSDHEGIVASPSSSWPYQLSFPSGGSTTQTVTMSTSATQATTVLLYSCKSGVDSSNSSNWSCTKSVTIQPSSAPPALTR